MRTALRLGLASLGLWLLIYQLAWFWRVRAALLAPLLLVMLGLALLALAWWMPRKPRPEDDTDSLRTRRRLFYWFTAFACVPSFLYLLIVLCLRPMPSPRLLAPFSQTLQLLEYEYDGPFIGDQGSGPYIDYHATYSIHIRGDQALRLVAQEIAPNKPHYSPLGPMIVTEDADGYQYFIYPGRATLIAEFQNGDDWSKIEVRRELPTSDFNLQLANIGLQYLKYFKGLTSPTVYFNDSGNRKRFEAAIKEIDPTIDLKNGNFYAGR